MSDLMCQTNLKVFVRHKFLVFCTKEKKSLVFWSWKQLIGSLKILNELFRSKYQPSNFFIKNTLNEYNSWVLLIYTITTRTQIWSGEYSSTRIRTHLAIYNAYRVVVFQNLLNPIIILIKLYLFYLFTLFKLTLFWTLRYVTNLSLLTLRISLDLN